MELSQAVNGVQEIRLVALILTPHLLSGYIRRTEPLVHCMEIPLLFYSILLFLGPIYKVRVNGIISA